MNKYKQYLKLVRAVAKIKKKAALYMLSDEILETPMFQYSDDLMASFLWKHTPQGFDYWNEIEDILEDSGYHHEK